MKGLQIPASRTAKENLTLEVGTATGRETVRAIAMDTTDGLVSRMSVRDTGRGHHDARGTGVPRQHLNVLGDP